MRFLPADIARISDQTAADTMFLAFHSLESSLKSNEAPKYMMSGSTFPLSSHYGDRHERRAFLDAYFKAQLPTFVQHM